MLPAMTHPDSITLAVTLVVRDLDTVERFYRDVIGLHAVARERDSVAMGVDGTAFLHLRHEPQFLRDDPAGAGLFHTAFLLPSRADLGGWLTHADRAGLRLDGAADHLVSEAAYLRDPESNGVEVYADRPRAGWSWRDGQVAMANDRLDGPGLRAAATAWQGAPAGTRIGHVHLRVGDVAAATRFYTGELKLDLVRAMPQAAFLSWGGYHHHIAVNTWGSAGAGPRLAGTAGLRSVAVQAATDLLPVGAVTLHDPWGLPLHVSAV